MELLANQEASWGGARKIGFRLLCVYVVMYALSHPFGVPFEDAILKYYNLIWDALVPWVGKHVLPIPYDITVKPAGSGDTTYNYVQIFCMVVLSVVLCLAWTLLDRKRRNYNTLRYWLIFIVRFYLALVLLEYGFVKVVKAQFPFPHLERLLTPYGDSSPMGLLWTFMGYSASYTFFAGLGEVTAGVLLLFRRTTTLGALVAIGVMSNVVMLNFSYDVPVKLFSLHLLLLAVLLVLRDLRRVVNVFVLNRPAPALDLRSPVTNPWVKRGAVALLVLVMGYVAYDGVSGALDAQRTWGDKRPKPALYGIYDVETFVHNGDTLAPLLTDSLRWHKLIVNWDGIAGVKMMDDKRQRYGFRTDTTAQTVTMFTFADTTQKALLRYGRPAPDALVLDGLWQGDTLSVRMKRYGPEEFLLVNRGFHWINEVPFSR